MSEREYFVYILANKRNGTLYIGVTNDLMRRVYEHKEAKIESFTKKYGINRLVYYEVHTEIDQVILREKQLKEWKRQWKIELIEKENCSWRDLYEEILQ